MSVNTDIQAYLKKYYNYTLAVDGDMGPSTLKCIKNMLKDNGVSCASWSSARLLVGAEQVLYRSEGIDTGPLDGFSGPLLKQARDVYQYKVQVDWRDRKETQDKWSGTQAASLAELGPETFYRTLFMVILTEATARGIHNATVIAHLGAAQASLETGYGKSVVVNNIYGIKGTGPAGSINAMTHEEVHGTKIPMTQTFRAYHNVAECAEDYLDVLQKNQRYAKLFEANTPEEAMLLQGKTGYSTYSEYGTDLLQIYRKYGMGIDAPEAKTKILVTTSPRLTLDKSKSLLWPRQRDVENFYGPAGENQDECQLPFPMKLSWDLETEVHRYTCHKKVKAPMERIWNNVLEAYGIDKIRELRLDLFGGCLNVRKMRGGSNNSMHSWGVAVDIDPDHNEMKSGKGTAPMNGADYDRYWQIIYNEGAISLGKEADMDFMHWQFARLH